ncbi:hypothetical protein Hanom_Chr09g00773331 [Helianthus anomalus]
MLVVCIQNVIPRRGDKVEVRYAEVPVLYMLLHGSPLVLFRFLILNNIWIGQNSGERKIFPHCRLITTLLKFYGATGVERQRVLQEYKELERYHKLKSDGQRWRALKVDARPLLPGEADEPESGDERWVEYWAHSGSMEQVVERRQAPTFADWSDSNQMLFDHHTYMGASMESSLKQNYDRQEQWNHAHMCVHQEEMNNRYPDDKQRRMYDAWHSGQLVVSDPPIVDYSTLPPYYGMGHQQTGQEGDQGGSSSGSFGFGVFADAMTSIFGPPQPRRY